MSGARSTLHHHNGGGGGHFPYDAVAVERAVARGGIRLTPPELCEASQILSGRGYSARRAALHIGAAERTIQRHRRCPPGAHRHEDDQ